MSYTMTSEFVTVGHPDRVADTIAARIIEEIQHKDKVASHAAIEVMLANDNCYIGGEATTTIDLESEAPRLVHEALAACGYTREYRDKFSHNEAYVVGDYSITVAVNRQSPDIAQGVGYDKGFNDQGVFCSSAEKFAHNKMGLAHAISKYLGESLFEKAKTSSFMGVDIKTLVSVEYENCYKPLGISAITVAVPTISDGRDAEHFKEIENLIYEIIRGSEFALYLANRDVKIIVNGTGAYHIHGSLGDTGVTGRKLAVNCNSLYSPIGGGALVKPAHASDLLLFLAARHLSKAVVATGHWTYCQVQLSCAIGKKELQSMRVILDNSDGSSEREQDLAEFLSTSLTWSPAAFDALWHTYDLSFVQANITNFTGSLDYDVQPWENTEALTKQLLEAGF